MVYLLFKNYKFSTKLSGYIGKKETRLLKNVRSVDYIAQYMEEHNYEKAYDALNQLDVNDML